MSTTHNFLHDRPALYDRVLPDTESVLARFAEDCVAAYAPGRRVLDVGCGLGREVAHLRASGWEAEGLDVSPAMVQAAATRSDGRFFLGSQTAFGIEHRYDAILCLGSTFLYNHDNTAISAALAEFRAHLVPGGALVLEMRNGAYFLTPEGQSWLARGERRQVDVAGGTLTYTARFELDLRHQLLHRYYHWAPPGEPPVEEHLVHRLLFPQEVSCHLTAAGFEPILSFDNPAPALGAWEGLARIDASSALQGRRLHVIARRR